jgi:gliding motility-associated-like protein
MTHLKFKIQYLEFKIMKTKIHSFILCSAALCAVMQPLCAATCPRNIMLAGSATVCAQGNSGQVYVTPTDSIRVEGWLYSNNESFNGYTEDNATTTEYPYNNLTQARYYKVRYYDSACNATYTVGPASVLVDAASLAGAISGSGEYCLGEASGTLTLSGHTGSVTGWQKREEGGSWQDVPQLSPTPALNFYNLPKTTQYQARVKNGVCPEVASDSVPALVHPIPQAGFTVDDVCMGEESRFADASTVSSGYIAARAWSFGDGASSTLSNPAHAYLIPASYAATLTVTSDKGCVHRLSQAAKVHVLPQADFEVAPACEGSPSIFTGKSSIASGERLSYSWAFGDGTSSTEEHPQHTYADGESRWARLQVQSAIGGCKDAVEKTNMQVDAASVGGAVSGNGEHCLGEASGELTLSGYTGSVIGWQRREEGGSWQNVAQTFPLLSYANLTKTTLYRARVKNGVCPEAASDSVQALVHPIPQAAFTVADVCLGEESRFADASTVSAGYLVARAWSFGDGASSTLSNPVHTYLNPASYAVTLSVTSDKGCVHRLTQAARVHVLPQADFDATSVCVGFPSSFTGRASIASGETLSYLWELGEGATSTLRSPRHTYVSSGVKQVRLRVQSSTGGCRDSVERQITVYAPPPASAGADTSVELGYSVELQASGGVAYSWSSAPGISNTTVSNPLVAPSIATQYEVRVEDENGCVAYDSVTVRVKDTQRITPSTIITPDGNGENDTWTVRNIESYPDAQVRVVDSRGTVVLSCTGYRNDWDARNRHGDILPAGTYYYIITFGDTGRVYKGAITVLRGN